MFIKKKIRAWSMQKDNKCYLCFEVIYNKLLLLKIRCMLV